MLAALASPFTAWSADKAPPKAGQERQLTIKLIGFNDYHGNLQSPGTFGENVYVPSANRPAVGGADALASHVKRLKAKNPHHVVVGAGDFIGASPLISALFNDEPAVETLNRIGLEINAVGNHEFDRGSVELLRLQSGGCKMLMACRIPTAARAPRWARPCLLKARSSSGSRPMWSRRTAAKRCCRLMRSKPSRAVRVAFIGMTLKATPTDRDAFRRCRA